MDYNLTVWKDHIKDQSGNIIQQGTPASAKNFNNMETAIANLAAQIEANAELVREATPSGFTTLPELDYAYMSANPNTIKLKSDAVAYVKGYKTVIPAGTVIQLSAPPVTGSREDLVFPECWKEVDANGVISWKWRLRVVDGVDFNKNCDGLGVIAGSPAYAQVFPQGSNNAPISFNSADTVVTAFMKSGCYYEDGAVSPALQSNRSLNDLGIYVAGREDANSKTTLGTADGYVYAIPMFRVARRNSSGYSVENANGSVKAFMGVISYDGITGTVQTGDITALKVGSKIKESNGNIFTIVGIHDNVITLDKPCPYKSGISTWVLCNRPDNLYADIIAERDIIDLRHQISLTGFNTQQLLEENFDKLLRGELQTKEKTKMIKTYHGVRKTPIDSNTVFYASFDGTTTAEIGGAMNLGTGSFKPMPTGLGYKFNGDSVTPISISGVNINSGTVDFLINADDLKNESDFVNVFTLSANDNSDVLKCTYESTMKSLYVLESYTDGSYVSSQGVCPVNLFNGSIHVRIAWDANNLYEFINGKLVCTKSRNASSIRKIPTKLVLGANATGGSKIKSTIADFSVSSINRGDVFATLPRDFIDGYARIAPAFNSQRKIFSDALTSQYTSDIVKASGVNAKQIAVAQKTAGVWTAGDTIKVKGLGGEIISGVIDLDTALARVISGGLMQIVVDDISKVAVNDKFKFMSNNGTIDNTTYTITDIDSTTKKLTFTGVDDKTGNPANITFSNDIIATWNCITEITVSSSSPTVKSSTGAITGTWSGLGTNEATFTLVTNEKLTNQDIQIEYSLNMPAGQGGISEVLTATLAGEYQGKKLAVNPPVHIRDDFAGKQKGSFIECPNIIKNNYGGSDTTLLSPSNIPNEITQGEYSIVSKQDQQCISCRVTAKNAIPQLNVQLSIIREIEDRFGPIPALNKIAWAKANVGSIEFSVYVSALSPTNKVYACPYAHDGGEYKSIDTMSATSANIVKLTGSASTYAYVLIDDNGMLSINVYADPTRTTDHGGIVLTNHGLRQYDLIENITRGLVSLVIDSTTMTPNFISLKETIAGQTYGDTIKKFKNMSNKTASVGTNNTTLIIPDHGLNTGDWIQNHNHGGGFSKVTVVDNNTLTLDTPIAYQTAGDDKIFLFHYIGTQTAENTVIPSQVNLDYAYLDITLKTPTGYDVLAPENPRRDDGRANMLLVRKETKEVQVMFNAKNDDGVVTYGDFNAMTPSKSLAGIALTKPAGFVYSLGTGDILDISKPPVKFRSYSKYILNWLDDSMLIKLKCEHIYKLNTQQSFLGWRADDFLVKNLNVLKCSYFDNDQNTFPRYGYDLGGLDVGRYIDSNDVTYTIIDNNVDITKSILPGIYQLVKLDDGRLCLRIAIDSHGRPNQIYMDNVYLMDINGRPLIK